MIIKSRPCLAVVAMTTMELFIPSINFIEAQMETRRRRAGGGGRRPVACAGITSSIEHPPSRSIEIKPFCAYMRKVGKFILFADNANRMTSKMRRERWQKSKSSPVAGVWLKCRREHRRRRSDSRRRNRNASSYAFDLRLNAATIIANMCNRESE